MGSSWGEVKSPRPEIDLSSFPEKTVKGIPLCPCFSVCSPEIEAPYTSEEEQERLLGLYQYLHSRAHNASRPLKTIYYTGPNENLLAWVRWAWTNRSSYRYWVDATRGMPIPGDDPLPPPPGDRCL